LFSSTSGFAKLGGGVTTQTLAGTKTAGNNPNGVRLHPQLRKAAGTCYVQADENTVGEKKSSVLKNNNLIMYICRKNEEKIQCNQNN